ncbi:hypothetical protein M011DRAFT_468319 [Sporormia fimetaria CBS 119925]|uniref:Phosphotransferase n=1 Tax=Sporormia fimetaria CBS 119925 TaxID=1340428 RepID=A0A6A6VA64_9PLEO|nr:hypothetical protein M011DRAFT_468319 [Sporormia fimetaria CBS 119925]
MPSSTQLVNQDASWRQRSELESMADLPPALEKELQRLDAEFWVSSDKLKKIVSRFRGELERGLKEEGKSIPMNVSWVHSLPSGDEKGKILTVDLGGTNLRVCTVELHGSEPAKGEKYTLTQEEFKLPKDLKTSTAEKLWTHIAGKIGTFLSDQGLDKEYSKDKPMPLGFTFSYPATQDKIDHAVLQRWTKGFDIEGVEGHDAAAQLREQLEARDLPVKLICVINDTVGAMVASAYNDPETIIGTIFGTGCNAAYMAKIESIHKLDKANEQVKHNDSGHMAINCEYGAFDNGHHVLPRTKYDERIDKESPRPGQQTFEKMSAGLYLGEIFRLVLLELVEKGLIFQNQNAEKLKHPYSIDTKLLTQIEDDESPKFKKTRNMFEDTLNLQPEDYEIELSRRLAELIAVRGARLCACGVAAICSLEDIKKGHVAADGSVANKHPKFKKRWATALGEILDWDDEAKKEGKGPIIITSAEDGSGVGCAIIAAMELERRRKDKS